MSRESKKMGKPEKGCDGAEKVVVAVKAAKEIPKTALIWALTHVVQPGDCITLLVVVSSHTSGRKFWGFPRFAGDCASGHRRSQSGTSADQKFDITDYCSQMILQLHEVYDPNKINVKIKIVSGTPPGSVAAEAKKNRASWVVLDKHLKPEEKRCMEELQCNVVVMKRSQPKVLRLNLVGSPKTEPDSTNSDNNNNKNNDQTKNQELGKADSSSNPSSTRAPLVTPSSSPEAFTATEAGTSSVSSSDPGTSPFFITQATNTNSNNVFKKAENLAMKLHTRGIDHHHEESSSDSDTETNLSSLSSSFRSNLDFTGDLREAISLSRAGGPPPLGPPPLCSICQHKAPVFGKPPRWFAYAELALATDGFSEANFLAEGGFGCVHRGALPDGRAIAVKQHKLASSQGDREFCSEVEVLSCAQHRNVVMLIGFCIEDGRRLLVYEYICNGSLDSHLYGRNPDILYWAARQKIAVGAARGLRYLHEECRVGCIVHRDMRPNNILITHDFEPLVGDFGLARWQPDGETGVETRVIGTFGYLAPEYAQSGQVTEKADVYSFGVVLVELFTGRKAVDLNRPKGQQCLTEWARPLLEAYAIDELVDPRLRSNYSENEAYCMVHAASLCLRRDPQTRPRMSQVLRILEGDVMDSGQMSTPEVDVGSRSGRIRSDHQLQKGGSTTGSESFRRFRSKLSLYSR
ncbi:hypothetical protein ABFX02_04G097700 [Erythranthe guttata]